VVIFAKDVKIGYSIPVHSYFLPMLESNGRQRLSSALGAAGLFFLELVKIIVLAGVTIFFVRYFLFKPFYVKGASMEPNFHEKEYLIIDELSYRLHDPKRGDVVVFRPPENTKEFFLKRIIGLPGERVKIAEGRVIIYNQAHPEGVVVNEAYLPHDSTTAGDQTVLLGQNEFFVLGDNRPNSFDSRRFGPIDRSSVVGRTWIRGWPFDRISVLNTPSFNF
jgi:signal peptidase I